MDGGPEVDVGFCAWPFFKLTAHKFCLCPSFLPPSFPPYDTLEEQTQFWEMSGPSDPKILLVGLPRELPVF